MQNYKVDLKNAYDAINRASEYLADKKIGNRFYDYYIEKEELIEALKDVYTDYYYAVKAVIEEYFYTSDELAEAATVEYFRTYRGKVFNMVFIDGYDEDIPEEVY